ncbi:MAG TPA: SWIM zinc finger family protein, partial [Pirellula sp.]|nr:SWIM zinc finger family protein [Pirellula sp.]
MPKKSVRIKAAVSKVSHSKNKLIHRVRKRISLRDRLGQLTIRAACRLLGASGDQRLRQASRFEIDLDEDVRLVGDTLTCRVPDTSVAGGRAIVSIVEMVNKPNGMHFHCNSCGVICEHVAATLSTVLENKLILGLSAIPDPHEPMENLSESELITRAIAERQGRAIKEKMVVKSADTKQLWTDYAVTSLESGKSYRVALRSLEHGESYCSCPDFRVNHLGTCKHILHVIEKVSKKFPKTAFQKPYSRKNISLRVDYGTTLGLRFNLPDELSAKANGLLKSVIGKTIENADRAVALIK